MSSRRWSCLSGSWLTLWFNLVALVFFLAFQIPGVGKTIQTFFNSSGNKNCRHFQFFKPTNFKIPKNPIGWRSMAELHPPLQHPHRPPPYTPGQRIEQDLTPKLFYNNCCCRSTNIIVPLSFKKIVRSKNLFKLWCSTYYEYFLC